MKKGKLRFNAIDMFIAVIAAILITAFVSYSGTTIIQNVVYVNRGTMRYTVSIEGFSEEFKDLIKVGDVVKNIDRDCEVGKVVEVRPTVNNISYNPNVIDGTYVAAEIPELYKCEIVIESEYTNVDNGYFIEQIEIKTGRRLSLKTPKFAFTGLILDIERSDG